VLGFAICLLGAFAIGYVQGIQSILPTLDAVTDTALGSNVDLGPKVVSMTHTYLDQNVTPFLLPLLLIGALMAVGGFVIIAKGDRRKLPAKAEKIAPASPS